MDKKQQLIKNTLIIAVGRAATYLTSFLLLPLYTFYLSPEDYGLVDLIVVYGALLIPLITVQLEAAAFRFLVDARDNEAQIQKIISNIVAMVVGIMTVLVILFATINPLLNLPYASLIVGYVCFATIGLLFLQMARGLGKNQHFAAAGFVLGLTNLIGAFIFIANLKMGAAGMLIAMILSNFFCALYLFFTLKLYKYLKFGLQSNALKKQLLGFSLPLIPGGISWWIVNASSRVVIFFMLGVGANGIYAVASRFPAIFASIFAIFGLSWTESASLHINDKDKDEFFSSTLNNSISLFGALGALLIAFTPLVFSILVDGSFGEAALYIPILVIGAFFAAVVELYGSVYIAKKLTKQVANTSIAAAVVNIILTLALVPILGLFGAAFATAIALMALAIFRHFDTKQYAKIIYRKFLFAKITGMFLVVIPLYYIDIFELNILSLALTLYFATLLNKGAWKFLLAKITRKAQLS